MDKIKQIGFTEFVCLMAILIALTALSIDSMLPALTIIGEDLGVVNPNNNHFIISTLFVGLGIGQLFFGPLSDNIGRKPTVYIGLLTFALGCLISMFSSSLWIMLIGRCLQGVGLSGPRSVSVAIIRDLYKGDKMAQVMSFIMAVFIAVPAIAPILGQGILFIANWRMIFLVLLLIGLIAFFWFTFRQQETLTEENRILFSFHNLWKALMDVFTTRNTIFYTLAAGFISSAFIGFLNLVQQILQFQFELGEKFPFYFVLIALSVGVASFVNGKLVLKFGMQKMVKLAVISVVVISIVFYGLFGLSNTSPSILFFMLYLSSTLFFVGILFGNLNSMAMEPLGHIAGLGAAIVGSTSTFISVFFGTYISMQYAGSVTPVVIGFLVFGSLCAIAIFMAEGKET